MSFLGAKQRFPVQKKILLRISKIGVDSLAKDARPLEEVPLSPRVVFLSLVFLTVPSLSQSTLQQHTPGSWSPTIVRPEPPRDLDRQRFKLQAIHQDTQDFYILSAQLQSDLQELQKGKMARDLTQNLKKMEKLSKRLRQEVAP